MKFWARLGLFFYMFIIILLSVGIAAFVLHLIGFQDVQDVLYVIYHEKNLRMIGGAVAALLLIKKRKPLPLIIHPAASVFL